MPYKINDYVVLSYKYDYEIVKIMQYKSMHYLKEKNVHDKYYIALTHNKNVIYYIPDYDILRRATDDEIKQYEKELKENENDTNNWESPRRS